MYIYLIKNTVNGKIYVGKDASNRIKRINEYFGSGLLIRNAIRRYGKHNFTKKIIAQCKDIDELNNAEIFWISKLPECKVENGGYNIHTGGMGGWSSVNNHPNIDEIRSKIYTKEFAAKISNTRKRLNIKHSKETYDKIVAKRKITYQHHSIETKEKIKRGNLGKHGNRGAGYEKHTRLQSVVCLYKNICGKMKRYKSLKWFKPNNEAKEFLNKTQIH